MALALVAVAPFVPAIAYETVQVTRAVVKDVENGTTRNTAEAACGAVGGAIGAVGGAVTGTAYMGPGVGTCIGATTGCIIGDYEARNLASGIFDEWGYEVEVRRCKKCGRRYRCRLYTGQSRTLCKACDDDICEC